MEWLPTALMILGAWNALVYLVFGIDKRKARRGRHRVSEGALLLCAALMGGLGALMGMIVFRHKTRHAKFVVGVPLLLVLNIAHIFHPLHPIYT